MRAVFGFLALAPVSGFIAAAILIAILLLLGDLIPFLTETAQWIAIAVIAGLWLLLCAIWWWRRRRRNQAMLEQIAEEEPDPTGEAIDSQRADIQAKFAQAMKDLSKLRFKSKSHGSRYVYELPWYIFIGPPGAGKTEALKNCGLEFPLRRGDGPISIDGGAGTRDCDWVFTNDAVFIDTAGRFTTRSSNSEVDAASWFGFLDLLRKYRPREPINGVIVAISVKDLATADPAQLDADAANIRDRLQELGDRMDARIPVYVMFTKADLLIGFTEFFQSMRPKEREQVWGATFPLDETADAAKTVDADLGRVPQDFDTLLEQLGEMQFTRLQEEADLGARSRIFGFPAQFSTLKPVVSRFLEKAFAPDRFSTPILLRGFYFTSATQIGQPVDRLIATLSREFGLEQRAVAALGGTGRAYFLSDLLKRVVFPEQGLIAKTAKRRSPVGRYAAIAAAILLPLLFAGGLYSVYRHNQAQAASLTEAIEGYEAAVGDLPINPVDDHDFKAVRPALDGLRAEAERLGGEEAKAPLFGLGIDDTLVLKSRADAAYETALGALLRPRLMYRYERRIEENLHRPGALYTILKTYLMIAGHGPLDTGYVGDQVKADWAEFYNPVTEGETLASLGGHLDALLSKEYLDPESLNHEAVALARESIAQISIAERAYRGLRASPEAQALKPWTATATGGRTTDKLFMRRSVDPIDKPIPGLFTYDGFWGFFLPQAGPAAKAALDETWLVADEGETTPDLETITGQMLDIYYEDYIAEWQGMLEDLRVAPLSSSERAAEILVSLSSTTSPLKRIMDSAAKETAIATVPGEDSPVMDQLKQIGSHALLGLGTAGRLAEAGTRGDGPDFGRPVHDHFADLREFAEGDESARLMAALRQFYGRVSRSAAGGEDLRLLSTTEEAKELELESRYAPPAIARIIQEMLSQADTASSVGVRARLSEIWSSSVYPQCRDRLHGRYPFGTGAEIPLGDLAEVLGPGGAIDGFFQDELAQYVDTGVTPWRWRPGVGAALGMAADRLAFFQQTAVLRDALFPNGSREARLSFAVYPITPFDPGVAVLRLNVGGAVASFERGRSDPSQLLWPGAQPANGATASLGIEGFINAETGLPETEELSIGEAGAWGLFKLADKLGYRQRGDGARGRIRVALGGRAASLELRMNSSVNPFALRSAMRSFRCPASL